MALSTKQLKAIGRSTGRVNIWDGSVRSGKTFSSILRLLAAISQASRYGEIVIVGKNRDSVYRNVFAPIDTLPDFEWVKFQVSYRQGAATGQILGRKIHVIGANDAKAESRVRGMTVTVAYIDELTVVPEDFFKQMLARMSAPDAILLATTNPDSPGHWLKAGYLDRISQLPDWRYFHFTLDDNPVLTSGYKESLKREYSGLWYRRFIEGEWVAAEGAIFGMWDPDKHVVPQSQVPTNLTPLGVGIDYGTANATASVQLSIDFDAGRLYATDEFVYSGRDTHQPITDYGLADRLESWLGGRDPGQRIVDPSALSFRTELQSRGIVTIPGDNDVSYGIRTVSSLLERGGLLVSDACPNLIREIPGYSWDSKAASEGIDKPVKVADHSIDALRYAVVTTETYWTRHVRK